MRIKKEIKEKEKGIESLEEGLMEGSVRMRKESWRIGGVYINKNIEGILKRLEQWMEGREMENYMLVGGDFNARTGREEGAVEEVEEKRSGGTKRRQSKNEKINREENW